MTNDDLSTGERRELERLRLERARDDLREEMRGEITKAVKEETKRELAGIEAKIDKLLEAREADDDDDEEDEEDEAPNGREEEEEEEETPAPAAPKSDTPPRREHFLHKRIGGKK